MGLLFNRNRHRAISGTVPSPYTPVATSIAWQSVQNNPAALGITGNAIAAVVDQRGAVMAGLIPSYVSGTPAKATINSSGIYTTVANGSTVITASYLALTAINTTITVLQVTASITLSPATPTVPNGTAQVFTATGRDSNNVICTLGAGVWASSDPTNFPINASTGSCTPNVSSSSAVIKFTETSSGVFGTTTITASGAFGLFTNVASYTGAPGTTFQLIVKYGADYASGTDVTADPSTSYSSNNTAFATVDPPTLTGPPSPASITQGTGPITYTWPCTNPRAIQTLGGLPTGVTAGVSTVVDPTHISFQLTATGSATPGSASVYLIDTPHGNSNTEPLTVSIPGPTVLPVSGAVLRLHANWGVTQAAGIVSQWLDQTATGAAFVQATGANKPTFVANVYKTGTKPTIRFAGSQWLATAANVAALNPATANFTLFVVFKLSAQGFTNRLGFDSSGYSAILNDFNNQYRFTWTGNHVNGGTPDTTTLHTFTGMLDLAVSGNGQLFVDNSLINSALLGSYTQNTTTPSYVGDSTGTFIGDICEIILMPPLNSTQLASMETYFQTEWGTP